MVTESAKKKGVDEAVLSRKRKLPTKLSDSLKAPPVYLNVKEKYKMLYFEGLKTIISNINKRFEKGYDTVINLENLLLKCAMNESYDEELKTVIDFYVSDFNKDDLETQLLNFKAKFRKDFKSEKVVLNDVIEFMRRPGYSELLSEVSKVLKLILVLPATNAQSERLFSKLKIVKTKLRNSMGQDRLNHIMMLYAHKDDANDMCLIAVANEFVAKCERRYQDFGVFV